MQRYIISFNYGAKQHTFFRIFTSSPSIYYPIVPIISKQILAKIKRIMAKIQLILAIIYFEPIKKATARNKFNEPFSFFLFV